MSWSVAPREPDLSRIYDPLSKWSKLILDERLNEPDTWTVVAPLKQMEMFDEGAGCLLFSNGEQVTSGEVYELDAGSVSDGQGGKQELMAVTFASDYIVVGDRPVVPSPTYAAPTGSVFNYPAAYDSRSGPIETVILEYIKAHAGSLALADLQVPRLRLPASLGRGGSTSVTARFDNLGTLVAGLAEAGNLRIDIKHTEDAGGGWLDLVIDTSSDLSADIRFGATDYTSGGRITDWSWKRRRPTSTRVLVAGGGELAARDMLILKNTAAETLWNRKIWSFQDQRNIAPDNVNKLTELTREGQKELDEGAGLVEIRFTPLLGGDIRYRRDLKVGDIVGYDLPRLPPGKDKIRHVRTEVTVRNGQLTEQLTFTVGTPDAPDDPIGGQAARALRDINVIERSQ